MSLRALSQRVARLGQAIEPKPLIIDCTGARDELMAKLRSHMTPEELYQSDNGLVVIDEETQQMFDRMHAFLEQDIKRIEQESNIRLVSYERERATPKD